jgi:predicted acetyltransferase
LLPGRDDWGPGLHEDGFGIGAEDDLDSPDGFEAWVQDRLRLTHPPGMPCQPEQHASPRWIVEGGRVLGGIALRHIFDDDRVLIVCEADNAASARTIERNGGLLEGVRDGSHGAVRRYWIKLHR